MLALKRPSKVFPLGLVALGALVFLTGCSPSGGPGIYRVSSEGLTVEVEIPVEPKSPLLVEILDYSQEMGSEETLTWAKVNAENSSDEQLGICEVVVLDESGTRVDSQGPRDLVTKAQDQVPLDEVEDYNRGVDLYNRTLEVNSSSLLPGERTEYYLAYSGDLSNPSAIFGGASTQDFSRIDCDNRASKIG